MEQGIEQDRETLNPRSSSAFFKVRLHGRDACPSQAMSWYRIFKLFDVTDSIIQK